MKKFLLLAATVAFSISSYAQIDTIYEQNFDDPAQVANINTYAINPNTGAINYSQLWKDTTNVAVSLPNSYRGQVKKGSTPGVLYTDYQVVWQTDFFSTKNKIT